MAASGSTGRGGRRCLLKAAALAPLALLVRPRDASGTDYASAGEALASIDALEAEVAFRLSRLEESVSSARAFAASLRRDQEAHRRERDAVRRRLGVPAATTTRPSVADALELEALRGAEEKLTYAHAEALPALGEATAVQTLARHMVDLSRHLTLVGLWIEAEERRG